MNECMPRPRRLPALAVYGVALVLCLLALTASLRLWRAHLNVPFNYGMDGLFTCMQVKTLVENGWYLHNPALGAPGTCQLYDFPMADNLHFALIKLLTLTGRPAPGLVNLYFLLTFPLTTLTTLFVLRHFRVSTTAAVLVSLLYAFCQYHLYRGTAHLFLSAYYLIPLMVMVILWVYQDPDLLLRWRGETGRRGRALAAIVICLLVASAGVYYAFFACFFLLVAGLAGAVVRGRLRALVPAVLLIGVLGVGFLANLTPSLLYAHRHGPNLMTQRSTYISAEIFGLKVAQLVLPVTGHHWPLLADLRARYDMKQEINESSGAALGLLGVLGFGLLLVRLVRLRAREGPDLWDGLTLLNLAAVLLGTLGGLGCLFALLVNPSIRAYNRVSIYIAFFALFALALLLDWACARWRSSGRGRWAYAGLCLGLAALGIWDQTTDGNIPNYPELKRAFESDRAFVRRIESILPPGSAVLQLPVVAFPENPVVCRMPDYDHFRGYLHSRTLRWSYGATKGREVGHWQAGLAERPLEAVLPAAAMAGFDGLWLNRMGYPDGAGREIAYLKRTLRAEPLWSGDGQLVFFDLRRYARELPGSYSPREWHWRQDINHYPLIFSWQDDFSPTEWTGAGHWNWCCSARGELHVLNPAPFPRTVRLKMRFAILKENVKAHLTVQGLGLAKTLPVTNMISPELAHTVVVPPGRHVVLFTSDAPPVYFPGDARRLVFRVEGLTAQEVTRDDGPPLTEECIQVSQGTHW